MRRPADVLVDGGGQGLVRGPPRRFDKLALDIKVINALGPDHFEATLRGSLCAEEAYRDDRRLHLDTARLCAEQRIGYEPLVFTRQGGCERHAEALLSQICRHDFSMAPSRGVTSVANPCVKDCTVQ